MAAEKNGTFPRWGKKLKKGSLPTEGFLVTLHVGLKG